MRAGGAYRDSGLHLSGTGAAPGAAPAHGYPGPGRAGAGAAGPADAAAGAYRPPGRRGAANRKVALRPSVSPRTVDHHLRTIFAALGVRSRVELSALVARGDPPSGAGHWDARAVAPAGEAARAVAVGRGQSRTAATASISTNWPV